MSIETLYILSGIKSIQNIYFMTPAEEKGSLTRFTPHGVKRVLFLMEYVLIYLELAACFFVLFVDKHCIKCPIKALNFIQK